LQIAELQRGRLGGEDRTLLSGIPARTSFAASASRSSLRGRTESETSSARDPEHAILKPQLAEIKRLKKVALGKKPVSQDPAPSPTLSEPAEKL
jgi:hypothetical protein